MSSQVSFFPIISTIYLLGCLKSRPAMRTEEFNLEKEDELAMGSCFETNRCDELNHSVIHFTKSGHNGLQRTTQILKTIEKPTATE